MKSCAKWEELAALIYEPNESWSDFATFAFKLKSFYNYLDQTCEPTKILGHYTSPLLTFHVPFQKT